MTVISVVLPTVDGREDIFTKVHDAYCRTPDTEIIVVRNAPTVGAAWQAGADKAGGDYLHFANDDCLPDDGWYEDAIGACKAGRIPSANVRTPDGYPQALPVWGAVTPDWKRVSCCLIPFMSWRQWMKIGPMFTGHYHCVTPETRVLTAGMQWVSAGKLNVGDDLVGVDEFAPPYCDRKFRHAVVLGNERRPEQCVTVRVADGREVTCTPDHAWLTRRWCKLEWVEASRLRAGDEIASPFRVWQPEDSYDAGWLAGIIDGEGTAGRYGSRKYQYTAMSIAQNPGPVLNRITGLLGAFGISYSVGANARTSDTRNVRIRTLPQILELIGRVQPVRLQPDGLWEGAGIRTRPSVHASVVDVADAGRQEIVALGTSTGTFLAEGMVSHNTDNWVSWRAERAGWPTVHRTGYAFTHFWAQPGRGAGMSEPQRMVYDERNFERAKVIAAAGKWTAPWPL